MSELNFIQKIFSLRNSPTHKIIHLLGFKISISRALAYNIFFKNQAVKNKIVFSNYQENGYGCNPKYIAEEIIRRNLDIELIWLLSKKASLKEKQNIPSSIKIVKSNSFKAMKELATAKFWVSNERLTKYLRKGLKKKENQIYIQTWHGSLGIKRLDADVPAFNTANKENWLVMSKYEASIINYLLINSDFEQNILPKALWYSNETVRTGHPRNDIFFYSEQKLEQIKNKVFAELNINPDTKILLYVPSFRDDYSTEAYNIDYDILKSALENKYGNNWKILVRLHPRMKDYTDKLIPPKDFIIDATQYSDIQELLSIADVLITDYSSCIFDYMLSKKPAFIYASDIEKFDNERGFYYPLTSTPFPVAENNEQLKENILNFDYNKYNERAEEFLRQKGCFEDGKASEKIVDIIEQEIYGHKTNK